MKRFLTLVALTAVLATSASALAYDKDSRLSTCLVDPTCTFETINEATDGTDPTFDDVILDNLTVNAAGIVTMTLTSYFTSLRVGTGSTADITLGVDDAFIEGTLEVDGEAQVDGLLDANLGIISSGAASTINHDSNFTTGIGTGTTTAAVTIGGGSNTVAVNSSAWDISTVGAVTTIGDIAAAASLAGGWDFFIAASAAEVVGASLDMVAATGGAGATTTAGAGGAFSIAGGTGGATFTGQVGAAGGAVTIVGGAGIARDGAGANDGSGGDLNLSAGAAGGVNGTAVGGNVVLNGGASGATIGMVKVGAPTLAITPAVNAFGVAGAVEFDSTLNVDGAVTFGGVINLTADEVGFTAAAVGNQICTTTCGAATCLFGYDITTTALVDCASALADSCVCD